jgi:hypothetical protein
MRSVVAVDAAAKQETVDASSRHFRYIAASDRRLRADREIMPRPGQSLDEHPHSRHEQGRRSCLTAAAF